MKVLMNSMKKEIRKKTGHENEENHQPTTSATTINFTEASALSFSNSTIKARTVERVNNSLPKSPRRKKEAIKSLASKCNMKIKLGRQAGRKKNCLSEEENKWVIELLHRADITYTTPGRRDNIYLGSFNKLKKYAQKRYLL